MRISPLFIAGTSLLFTLISGSILADTATAIPSRHEPMIIGGESSPAFPQMVALIYRGEPDASMGHFCGGTLIDREWVLTAAHCLIGMDLSEIQVVIGDPYLDQGSTRLEITEGYIHPNYMEPDVSGDIALLHLAKPYTLTNPIKINNDPYSARPGVMAKVYGWGYITTQGDLTNQLMQTELPLQAPEESALSCSMNFEPHFDQLVAGNGTGTPTTCSGDSGGPLLVKDETSGAWVLAGLVSGGSHLGCTAPDGYVILLNPTPYLGWINQRIENAAITGTKLIHVGQLTENSPIDTSRSFGKFRYLKRDYTVSNPPVGESVNYVLYSNNFTAILKVIDPSGSEVASVTASDTGKEAVLEFIPQMKGNYTLRVTTEAVAATGVYFISNESLISRIVSLGTEPIFPSQTISDRLDISDHSFLVKGATQYVDYYLVSDCKDGERYTVQVSSRGFKLWINLYNFSTAESITPDYPSSYSQSLEFTSNEDDQIMLLITSDTPNQTGTYTANLSSYNYENQLTQIGRYIGPLEHHFGYDFCSWLGNGDFYDYPYLNHHFLGWIYPAQGNADGLWLWSPKAGWLWTNQDVYPFLWNPERGWLWHFEHGGKPGWLWEFDRNDWYALAE